MSFRVEKDIMVPMRDGIELATDAWIPDGRGRARPCWSACRTART